MYWVAQVFIIAFATFQGIYISYPVVIDKTCKELTPEEGEFLLKMSTAYKACGAALTTLDGIAAVLLLISMKRIYFTIKTHYPLWNANRFFIALQAIAFVAPVVIVICSVFSYKPQTEYSNTFTFEEMLLWSMF